MTACGCKPSGKTAESDSAYESDARPNIVLITICSCRYRNMGFAGYDRPTTPFIDELARGGVVCDNTMGAASWTKPSTASIITGLTPNVHGMTDYYKYTDIRSDEFAPKRILPDSIVTLAECLREAGYATITRNNNIHASHYFNMTQGFDNDRRIRRGFDAPRMLEDFRKWLAGIPDTRPFFFFMLNADCHMPYVPKYEYYKRFNRIEPLVEKDKYPQYAIIVRQQTLKHHREKTALPEHLATRMTDLYDAELAQLDAALSHLPGILQDTGRWKNTLIVLTADHGERLNDPHGIIGHSSRFMEEQLVQIPLVFYGPGIPAGVAVSTLVRSIDIYPTLADLAGATPPDILQGRSLAPLVAGETLPMVNAFASHRETSHVLRSGRFKLHQLPDKEFQLYRVDIDPDELNDLAESKPTVLTELRGQLQAWLNQEKALRELVDDGQTRTLTAEAIEELEALGYLDG